MNTKKLITKVTNYIVPILVFIFTVSVYGEIGQQEITQSEVDSMKTNINSENIDTSYNFQWNEDSARWEYDTRTLRYLTDKDKSRIVITQTWKKTNQWIDRSRVIKSYNSLNKTIEEFTQSWDDQSGQWQNKKLKEYKYIRQRKKSEVYVFNWNNSLKEWQENLWIRIDYGGGASRKKIVTHTYPNEVDKWVKYEKIKYYYNDGHINPSKYILAYWNNDKQKWEKHGRYTLEYNARGKITEKILATWTEWNNKWNNNEKYLYDWDGDNKIREVHQIWNNANNQWRKKRKNEYEYNEEGKLKIEEEFKWNNDQNKWRIIKRLRYGPISIDNKTQREDTVIEKTNGNNN